MKEKERNNLIKAEIENDTQIMRRGGKMRKMKQLGGDEKDVCLVI